MKSEWKRYTIEDIASISAGGDKPKVCSNVRTAETPFPVFSNGLESCGLYGYTNKAKIEGDTITISARGVNVGTVCYRKEPFLPIVRLLSLIPDRKIVNARYLYYLLRNTPLSGTGSAQPQITVPMIKKQEICIHNDIETQKSIAGILSCLDEKIALNKAINENLQEQAQAIYADMFITNADPEWPLGHLSDLITVKYGKDHKKLGDGSYPVYGSGGIMRYVERSLYDKESVLIPRKGTLNNVLYVNEPFWSVDTMFFTEMKQPDVAKYVYHFVKSKDLASLNAGSAVPSMTTDILNAMELSIPDENSLSRFESIVAPLFLAMQQNTQESSKLAELRDSLLPRLMSGDIDVSNLDL